MIATYRALLWKEAHEARWALYAGFAVLIAMPVLQAANRYMRWSGDTPILPGLSEMTFVAGGVVVTIAAIIIASRDFRDGECSSWRALPIKPLPFLSTKFIAGMVASIGVVILAQFVDMAIAWYVEIGIGIALQGAIQQLTSHVFLLAALYAIVFAITSASRHVMTAIFLSVIAASLLYFLPLLVPSLAAANFWALAANPSVRLFTSLDDVRYIGNAQLSHLPCTSWSLAYPHMLPQFVAIMLGITASGTVASWCIVRRNISLHFGVWRIAWLMVVLALGLFATAGAQVGSNLEPVAVVPMSDDGRTIVMDVKTDGDAGMAMVFENYGPFARLGRPIVLAPYDPVTSTITTHPAFVIGGMWDRSDGPPTYRQWAWSPKHPSIVYAVFWQDVTNPTRPLAAIDLDQPIPPSMVDGIYNGTGGASLCLVGDDVYVLFPKRGPPPRRLARFDLADPRVPRFDRTWDVPFMTDAFSNTDGDGTRTLLLPRIDDLTWEQRFELRTRLPAFPGAMVVTPQRVVYYSNGLEVFEVVDRDDDRVTYRRTSLRRETPLESLMNYRFIDALLDGDLLYLVSPTNGMVVFDIADPTMPKKVGHYLTPDDHMQCLVRLPDGRVAAFGRSMHVFDLD
jgi:hypothetical protein